jgi:glycosyltransferase involved in cell wall biosynthesis
MTNALRSMVEVSGFMVALRTQPMLRAALPPGVRYRPIPLPSAPLASLARAHLVDLSWALRGVDLVHGANFVLPPTRRLPRVVTVHDLSPLAYPRFVRPEVRGFVPELSWELRHGTVVHTPSRFVREEVLSLLGGEADQVVAIPHGVTVPVEVEAAPQVVADLACRPFLLALSTLEPRKGVAYLLEALRGLAQRFPEVVLVLAGQPGWQTHRWQDLLRDPLVAARVRVLGYVDDRTKAWLLRHATLFVYPSLYEGFGLPVLEALAVGTPVVATTAGAIPEVAGTAACLVPPRSAEALVAALERLLGDETARAALAAAGPARAAGFSWPSSAVRMVELYRQVLDRC